MPDSGSDRHAAEVRFVEDALLLSQLEEAQDGRPTIGSSTSFSGYISSSRLVRSSARRRFRSISATAALQSPP